MITIDQSLMQQAGQYQQLSANEQRSLARRVQTGDQSAREQLILHNLRLVIGNMRHFPQFIAKHFEDLYQAGMLGLLIAVDRYDPDRKATFSTYATHWIRCTIRLWIYQQNVLHVSKDIHDEAIKIRQQAQDGCVTSEASTKRAGLALEYAYASCVSLDDLCTNDEDEDSLWSEVLADPCNPFEDIEEDSTIEWLLSVLTPRERRIVTLHFGFGQNKTMKMADIAKQTGLSRRTANYIYLCAIRKLQRAAGVCVDQEAKAS